jgi:hypothetical protein
MALIKKFAPSLYFHNGIIGKISKIDAEELFNKLLENFIQTYPQRLSVTVEWHHSFGE